MIRLFAALCTPHHIAEGLKACQQGLRSARWSEPENLHITLRFFGAVSEPIAERLDDWLAQIRQAPFDVRLEGAGVQDRDDRRPALFAAAAPLDPLKRLAGKCETAARKAGLAPDARTYRPHLTLAYLSEPPGPAVAAWVSAHNLLRSPPWRAERFFLYSSRLGRTGPRYDVEREYMLK
jgi:2'-5' RNA ligase